MRGQDQKQDVAFAIHPFGGGLQYVADRRDGDVPAGFRIGAYNDRAKQVGRRGSRHREGIPPSGVDFDGVRHG
jgi:hypothetical protein